MKKFAAAIGAFVVLGTGSAFAAPEAVDELNELLRGEISAVETYRQALEKVGTQPEAATLKDFMNHHRMAADTISGHVKSLGGTPSTDSGAWGAWAKTFIPKQEAHIRTLDQMIEKLG